jgi:hypothetical protein
MDVSVLVDQPEPIDHAAVESQLKYVEPTVYVCERASLLGTSSLMVDVARATRVWLPE